MERSQIDTVSAAVFEAQAHRHMQLVRWMVIGWAATAVVLCFVLLAFIGTWSEEVTTETWTETTTVSQDGGDGGTNNYAGGDLIGNANYYGDENVHEDDGEARAWASEGQ